MILLRWLWRDVLRPLLRLLFPEMCAVCGHRLEEGEGVVCNACFASLPFTRFRGRAGNVVERLFWGRLPVVRANAYVFYHSGAASSAPVLQLKYRGRSQVGRFFGRAMAADLAGTGFFDSVDVIVPVPLAHDRQLRRGYNQSLLLAAGVGEITGLPVVADAVERVVSNPTQTRLHGREREMNVAGIFRLVRPEEVAGRHVLLVDDVLTTGATMLSCAGEVARAPGVRLSVLVLGLAGTHSLADAPPGAVEWLPRV